MYIMVFKHITVLIFKIFFLFSLSLTLSCQAPFVDFNKNLYICLTFDDGHESIFTNALPLLNEFGYSATNFINTGNIGKPGSLSWEQVEDLEFIYQWETAGHTLNHIDLTEVCPDVAENELKQDWLNLKTRGLSHESFALPSGHATLSNIIQISRYYKNIRNSRDKKMFYPINRKDIGYFFYQSSFTYEDVLQRIISGKANGENLIVIGFHRVMEYDFGHPANCKPQDLYKIMHFLNTNGLNVLNLNDAIEKLTK